MTAREDRVPMTVAQIREALAGLPNDAVPTWSSWDSEYGYTHVYGVESITPDGHIRPLLTGGFFDQYDDEDADSEESEAEQATAGAESHGALYHGEADYAPDGDPDAYDPSVKAMLAEGEMLSKKFPKGLPDGYIA